MPRPPRADESGAIYHALNRGNARQTIFHKAEDFAAFERVIISGLEKHPVELYSYQWMPNHWHMVLSPLERQRKGVRSNSVRHANCFVYCLTRRKGFRRF